jgi:hypothetical protein
MKKTAPDTREPAILFVIQACCEYFLKYLSLLGFMIFRPAHSCIRTEERQISLHGWIKKNLRLKTNPGLRKRCRQSKLLIPYCRMKAMEIHIACVQKPAVLTG